MFIEVTDRRTYNKHLINFNHISQISVGDFGGSILYFNTDDGSMEIDESYSGIKSILLKEKCNNET